MLLDKEELVFLFGVKPGSVDLLGLVEGLSRVEPDVCMNQSVDLRRLDDGPCVAPAWCKDARSLAGPATDALTDAVFEVQERHPVAWNQLQCSCHALQSTTAAS